MLIKKLLLIIICVASFVACNIEPGKHQSSNSKTVSQLDTVWKEVAPFKKKHDILDTDTVLIGTSDSMMQKYNASLEKLDGIIHRIARKVKHYDKQPIYWVEVENTGGPFMLFEINGIPHSYAFTKRQPDHRIDYLNPYIEKSGEQTLKIRAFSDENASFEKRWYTMSVRIGYGADKRESGAAPEYLTEIITLPEYVLDNGTQYWDTTITFQAHVPWDHSHRLENAVDLRTLPDLEERVLRKYEELRQFLVNCDITGYIEEDAERGIHYMERLYISDYSKIKKQIYSLTSSFIPNHPEKVIFPIQNVELALYNDGKIALLRHASLKNSALWFTDYVPEIQETLINSYFSIFLYLPEGETELQVY